jgi:hypothetical protein
LVFAAAPRILDSDESRGRLARHPELFGLINTSGGVVVYGDVTADRRGRVMVTRPP